MGLSFRVFFFDDDDSMHRISLARYERLFRGEERLSQYAGKRVRCAMAVVEVEGRTPVSIARI